MPKTETSLKQTFVIVFYKSVAMCMTPSQAATPLYRCILFRRMQNMAVLLTDALAHGSKESSETKSYWQQRQASLQASPFLTNFHLMLNSLAWTEKALLLLSISHCHQALSLLSSIRCFNEAVSSYLFQVAGYGNKWIRGTGETTRVTKAQIQKSVDDSLQRLNTDYVDLLQVCLFKWLLKALVHCFDCQSVVGIQ